MTTTKMKTDRNEGIIRYESPVGSKGNKAIILIPKSVTNEEIEKLVLYLKALLK